MDSEIIDKLNASTTVEEVERVIETYYPNWLVISLDAYSNDYPHLQKNWHLLCEKMNVQPQKIVLVNSIDFGDTPTTQNKICDFMTKHGYVVRRTSEFIACAVCEKAIPCLGIWNMLKHKKFPVPQTWSNTCSEHSTQSTVKTV
jgi:hypothetical protein